MHAAASLAVWRGAALCRSTRASQHPALLTSQRWFTLRHASSASASNASLTTVTAAPSPAVPSASPASAAPSASPKLRTARPSPRSLAHVKQTPLFPGMFRHVSMFEGEHVHNYGLHTFAIMRDSAAMGVLPAGCLLGFVLTHTAGLPLVPFPVQCAYLASLFVLSRVVAGGKRNRSTKELTGRHVVVTGATSGIGKATAAQLAAMGADVTLIAKDATHAAAAAALEHVRAHAKDAAVQDIHVEALNLDDFIAVREVCKRMRQRGRPIDILVNAAGVLQDSHATTRFGDDVQLAANFLGPYLLTEGLLPLVEAAHGRIVYVTCSAHVGVKGNVVSTYLSGRGVWSPRVANRFDGLEQYGFTKLGNIFHAQQLALRSYPELEKGSMSSRLTRQASIGATGKGARARGSPTPPRSGYAAAVKAASSASSPTGGAGAAEVRIEPRFTCCACSPGGVITNLYRSVPLASTMHYAYYLYALVMRTAWEGSQTVVNCCVRDDFKNGGYYMNARYRPAGLSKTACSVAEREQVLAWTLNKMKPYMKWD